MIVILQVLTLAFCAVYCTLFIHWSSLVAVAVGAGMSHAHLHTLWTGPYDAVNRPAVMKAVVALAVIVNAAFVVAILLGAHFAQ